MSERGGPTVLIAVGDELLSGHTLDTNSNLLAKALFAAGHPVRRIEVVGDDPDAIIAAVRRAQTEAGVSRIVVSGGIGPTPDDRTFGAVARALDRPLELNPVAFAHIETLVRRMVEEARPGKVPVDVVVTESATAHREIVAQAESLKADLLVMGTHGRAGFDVGKSQ